MDLKIRFMKIGTEIKTPSILMLGKLLPIFIAVLFLTGCKQKFSLEEAEKKLDTRAIQSGEILCKEAGGTYLYYQNLGVSPSLIMVECFDASVYNVRTQELVK